MRRIPAIIFAICIFTLIGEVYGADYVITDSIIKTGNIYIINSRLINAESGVVKDGDMIRAGNEESCDS